MLHENPKTIVLYINLSLLVYMGFGSWLKQKYENKRKEMARSSAANKIIREKAETAYYQAKEKEAIKAAKRRAANEYKPAKKSKLQGDLFGMFNTLAGTGKKKSDDLFSGGFF